MPDVVFALVANPYRNSRAVRQIRLLAAKGLTVLVLAVDNDAGGMNFPKTIEVRRVQIRKSSGPGRFFEIHRRFLDVARGIDASRFHASDLYVLGAMATAAAQAPSGKATYSYDARECYPHVAATIGRPWVGWYWRKIEKRYVPGAAYVFTVSESIARHMENDYGIKKPAVVMNVPETTASEAASRENAAPAEPSNYLRQLIGLAGQPDTPIILHSGQMRPDRGCEILVRSMLFVDRAHLVFMGSGPLQDALESLVSEVRMTDRVHFIDPVSPDQVVSVTSGASIGVTLLKGTCRNHQYALPNKLFEYIAAGIPVVASSLTELTRILISTGAGLTVREFDPESVGMTIQQMLDDPESMEKWSAAARAARETFTWDKASQPFRDAFSGIL